MFVGAGAKAPCSLFALFNVGDESPTYRQAGDAWPARIARSDLRPEVVRLKTRVGAKREGKVSRLEAVRKKLRAGMGW